ncbi:maleylpyruvate isomerase family mycothiol-dependent enzyme [Ktedonosporobacter rubrisoli]|uniref:Maleylpyruvate isomerase family mycothiol-dependent enzyme n=1 Tax=Ktedonosporobacter rubrisoli TaxID=2509675 RepID=A0A4V0YZ52_KTERU|nr:maleylpyruvate isomerase family mycothiol-dependent enzyme [Ktedonosporobacter rubrisoli]QBD78511.1 maleylpyruvate isomerase family mycothiol-dependent enzyme [Ktedonosporobacter rubrisoli]
MKPVEPIFVVELFEPMLDQLLQLLRPLSTEEWSRLTPCVGWTVKDVALHLLGDEIGQLSRGRDKDTSSLLPPGPDLVSRINQQNALWVEATRGISPRLLCELLDSTGHQVIQYFKSLDLMALNGPVSWAGPDPAPVWFDVAREYTERWHHQQHIREALERPGLTEATFLTPILDTFVRALPWTFRSVEATKDTVIQLSVTGDVATSWFLQRHGTGWLLFAETAFPPTTTVTLDPETAWKLFTKGITPELARSKASIQGNAKLASKVFETVAIIA